MPTSAEAATSVTSIKRIGNTVAYANSIVSWKVIFNASVTGVNAADFSLAQSGGATGASISSVTGSGTTWTLTANSGTGTSGLLGLNLIDNDTIVNATSGPLGGVGAGNGNYTGEIYTLLPPVCNGASDIIYCDDFERSNAGLVGGNGYGNWTVTPANAGNCNGVTGNINCAGIDFDIPPFNDSTKPRANPTRSLFTRWSIVSVDSPTINLSGKFGAQLSFWMRRGSDTFSEYPEAAGENYLLQYYASNNTWKILAQYPSGILQGQVFTPVIELPPDALHAGFRMRFYQPSGSGDANGGTNGGAPGVAGYDYWHMDDVIIREKTGPSYVGAFCDNFEAGLGRWSITAENAPTSGNIGDASIGSLAYQSLSHELDMRWGYVTASTFKTDLTGVSGNISYWLKSGTSSRDPATNQNLVAEYLNSSGNWITLATYLGSVAAGTTYTASHVIPGDAKHANFRLRFRQVAGSGYNKSYWHLDDTCVGNLLPTADLALSKTAGTLVPGSTTTYTLKASNRGPGDLSGSMSVVDTLPTGITYLNGSGTGWICSASGQVVTCNWAGTLVNGAVAPDLTLAVAVASTVNGSVTNTATLSGTVNDPVPSNNTASYTSGNFLPSYVFTDAACTNGIAIGQPGQACHLISWSPQVAGQSKSGIFITVVNAAQVPTQLSASSPTTLALQFGLTCYDPTTNAGVQATFSAASSALPLCTSNGAQPTSWTTASNLTFVAGAPSVAASYTFNYSDVGEVALFMRNSASTSQMATSGRFVSKPAGFVLTEIKPTSNATGRCSVATTPAPSLVCASSAASSAKFVRAGESFSATVKALLYNGSAAPNFGNEVDPESVMLNPLAVDISMVNIPAVTGSFGSFSGGVASGSTFGWGEVGIITLTPQIADGDYLGAGNIIGTTTTNVGRFIPDHFAISSATLTAACSSSTPFTYFNQDGFTTAFTITAQNAMNGTTQNYDGAFANLDLTNYAKYGFSAATLPTGSGLSSSVVPPSGSWNNGVAAVSVKHQISRPTALTAETPITVSAAPNDGEVPVSSATSLGGATKLRYGRLKMQNAYGSELLNLPIMLEAQYWNGLAYIRNQSDSCTTVPATSISMSNYFKNLSACETQIGFLSGTGTFTNGVSKYLRLSKPGAGNNGSLDLTVNTNGASGKTCATSSELNATSANVPWFGVTPASRATFGIFKTPIIYIRENF